MRNLTGLVILAVLAMHGFPAVAQDETMPAENAETVEASEAAAPVDGEPAAADEAKDTQDATETPPAAPHQSAPPQPYRPVAAFWFVVPGR